MAWVVCLVTVSKAETRPTYIESFVLLWGASIRDCVPSDPRRTRFTKSFTKGSKTALKVSV